MNIDHGQAKHLRDYLKKRNDHVLIAVLHNPPLSLEKATNLNRFNLRFAMAAILSASGSEEIVRFISQAKIFQWGQDPKSPQHDLHVGIQRNLITCPFDDIRWKHFQAIRELAKDTSKNNKNLLLQSAIDSFAAMPDDPRKQRAAETISSMVNDFQKADIALSPQSQHKLCEFIDAAFASTPYVAHNATKFIGSIFLASPHNTAALLSRCQSFLLGEHHDIKAQQTASLVAQRFASSSGRIAHAVARYSELSDVLFDDLSHSFAHTITKLADFPFRKVGKEEKPSIQIFLAQNIAFIESELPEQSDAWSAVREQLTEYHRHDISMAMVRGDKTAKRQARQIKHDPSAQQASDEVTQPLSSGIELSWERPVRL